MKKTSVSKIIKYVLSLALAALFVYFAFRKVEWAEFLSGLRQTRWLYVALFFVVSTLALVFRQERWRLLIKEFDPDARRLDIWDAINVSNVANIVLPGAGEFVRCGYVTSKRMSYDKAFGTIMCERACDVVSVALIFVVALGCMWDKFGAFFVDNLWEPLKAGMDFSLWWIAAPVLIALVLFFVFVFRFKSRFAWCSRIAATLNGLGSGFATIARIKRKGAFILFTLGIWLMYLLMSYFMLLAVPSLSNLSLLDALFISGVGNIASVIPVPGGIGAYHYLVALCLQSLYAASWETGILYATLSHELHALLIVLLGLISYIRFTLRKKTNQ